MIRSTKVSLKFANIGKRKQLAEFVQEFRRVASLYLDVLCSTFVNVDFNDHINSFDGYIHLRCLGRKMILNLPFRRTKHLNKLKQAGKVRPCMRLTDSGMVLMFEVPDVPTKMIGSTLGVDIGIASILSCSDGKQLGSLSKVLSKLKRKKRGSKAFGRCQTEHGNVINHVVNQLDLTDVGTMRIEDIKQLRYKVKNVPRFLRGFTYPCIAGRLENACKTNGVRIEHVDPAYTSQRCSKCGWTLKANRRGKAFVCKACGFACDADVNAAANIACELPKTSGEFRSHHWNLSGFWLHEREEPIAPSV